MDWTIVQGGLCKRGTCSDWASGLSLAAEQGIDVGSRNMDMGVLQVALGCSEWASGLSFAAEQSIEVGSRNMDMGFLQGALF